MNRRLLLLPVLFACGHSGPGAVDGRIGGAPFTVRGSVLAEASVAGSQAFTVIFSSSPTPCEPNQATAPPSMTLSVFGTAAGEYPVADANALKNDPRGQSWGEYMASPDAFTLMTGGSVTVEAADPKVEARGRFELQLGADRVTGWFDATPCPAR